MIVSLIGSNCVKGKSFPCSLNVGVRMEAGWAYIAGWLNEVSRGFIKTGGFGCDMRNVMIYMKRSLSLDV